MSARRAAVAPPVDVCLIVEGSYPYVTGGVASWVHQLVTGLPELRFALVAIVPDVAFGAEDRYPLPANVVSRRNVVLFPPDAPAGRGARLSRELTAAIDALHAHDGAARCPYFATVERLVRAGGHTAAGLLAARGTWELVQALYRQKGRTVSFLDYYWTWRAIHAPLLRLVDAELPRSAVYHAVSAGYAGFLGAIAQLRTDAGFLLTEHGLYTREREIEIAQAAWIYDPPGRGSAFAPRDGFFHGWWRSQYQFLARLAYARAGRILTLHGANARLQVEAGAEPAKIAIVPNGIRTAPFEGARRRERPAGAPFEVALVGRVVPIKDVLTFLRAVHLAAAEVPLMAHVLGPVDEDPAYHAECLALVRLLGLEGVVDFPGKVEVAPWLARVDAVVSTSISESQPLALLEAMAAARPVIATDVGACREMLHGRPGADALLGPAGIVVPVVSPAEVAASIIALAQDRARCEALGASGVRRVEAYYTEARLLETYRRLYRAPGRAPQPAVEAR